MIHAYIFFIAFRFIFSREYKCFINLQCLFSIVGVALGVASLIVLMALFDGFSLYLKQKVLSFEPHIYVFHDKSRSFRELDKRLLKIPEVDVYSDVYIENAFLKKDKKTYPILLLCYRNRSVHDLFYPLLRKGAIVPNNKDAVFGQQLVIDLIENINEEFEVVVSGVLVSGDAYKVKIGGQIETGLYNYDKNVVMVDFNAFNMFFNEKAGTYVWLKDPFDAEKVKLKLEALLGDKFIVRTWVDTNKVLFSTLNLQKLIMAIICLINLIITWFLITSTIHSLVDTKVHDIGILKAIGLSKKAIQKLFMAIGVIIAGTGISLGVFLGLSFLFVVNPIILLLEQIFGVDLLARNIFQLGALPIKISFLGIFLIVIIYFVLAILSSFFPAVKAAKKESIKAIHYA
jgi:lipoprotein-releasing system permease protein